MKWKWLGAKRLFISKSWLFYWPDASKDKCIKCAVPRGVHGRDHEFVEVKEKS